MLKFWYVLMAASLNPDPCKRQRGDVQDKANTNYYRAMLRTRPLFLLTHAFLLWGMLSQGSLAATELADELNDLRQEKRQLEREVAQYRASIDLLRASGAGGIDSSTLQSLSEEVGRTRARIQALEHRELELLGMLENSTGSTDPAVDPAASDVARLTQLLKAHYSGESVPEEAAESAQPAPEPLELPQVDIGSNKVMLTGTEGVAAINLISERLSGPQPASQLRDVDIVFNIETRRNGDLVSSSNHTLKALGSGQYVGKVALAEGSIRIVVRGDEWRSGITAAAGGEYLVTLHASGSGQAQLHLIPVDELLATRWAGMPSWLPPMGATTNRS
jgi:hypothetical protein